MGLTLPERWEHHSIRLESYVNIRLSYSIDRGPKSAAGYELIVSKRFFISRFQELPEEKKRISYGFKAG